MIILDHSECCEELFPAFLSESKAPSSDEENEKAGTSRSPSKTPEKPKESPKKEEQCQEDEQEDEEIPASPSDVKESIKQKFLVEMPEDFYDFWEFAKTVNSKTPKGKGEMQLVSSVILRKK